MGASAPARARRSKSRPTLDEIRSTWPAVVRIAQASTAFDISRAHGYNLVKAGQFPAKVIEAGGRKVVVTASIIAVLSDTEGAA